MASCETKTLIWDTVKKNLDDTAGALSLGYNHLNTFFRIFILYSLKSDYAVAVTFCSITQS